MFTRPPYVPHNTRLRLHELGLTTRTLPGLVYPYNVYLQEAYSPCASQVQRGHTGSPDSFPGYLIRGEFVKIRIPTSFNIAVIGQLSETQRTGLILAGRACFDSVPPADPISTPTPSLYFLVTSTATHYLPVYYWYL